MDIVLSPKFKDKKPIIQEHLPNIGFDVTTQRKEPSQPVHLRKAVLNLTGPPLTIIQGLEHIQVNPAIKKDKRASNNHVLNRCIPLQLQHLLPNPRLAAALPHVPQASALNPLNPNQFYLL